MCARKSSAATGCECARAGWCERHRCEKTDHWHMLCRTRADYFELWEAGRGPGQTLPGEAAEQVPAGPPLLTRAWNLAESLVSFVADGCLRVTRAQYRRRLKICDGCPRRRDNVCLECGCYLPAKAQARAMSCPLGQWPDVPAPVKRGARRQKSSTASARRAE